MAIPFNARLHVPMALEMSLNGKSMTEIAQKIGVHEPIMSPSGHWHTFPEWKEAYPIIKQNCKMNVINGIERLSEDPSATATMLNAKKWLASVTCGLSEKVEQSIEIEGNLHSSKSPLVLSFRDAKIKD